MLPTARRVMTAGQNTDQVPAVVRRVMAAGQNTDQVPAVVKEKKQEKENLKEETAGMRKDPTKGGLVKRAPVTSRSG